MTGDELPLVYYNLFMIMERGGQFCKLNRSSFSHYKYFLEVGQRQEELSKGKTTFHLIRMVSVSLTSYDQRKEGDTIVQLDFLAYSFSDFL
jgi:hypothetical protein